MAQALNSSIAQCALLILVRRALSNYHCTVLQQFPTFSDSWTTSSTFSDHQAKVCGSPVVCRRLLGGPRARPLQQKRVEKSFVGEIKLLHICFKLNFTCKSAEKNEMTGRKQWK